MGWHPLHIGSGRDAFLDALRYAGVPTEEVEHGVAFTATNGDRLIVEEYLTIDEETGAGGHTESELVVYKEGERPRLYTEVIDGGYWHHGRYPTVRSADGCEVSRFMFCINDGSVELYDWAYFDRDDEAED